MPDIIETTDAAGSSATTYTLGLGQTAQGELATGADRDWYAVALTAGQTYSFAMTGTGTNNVADTYLRLYSLNGVTLLRQIDDGLQNANSLITFTANTSGTYYLAAGSYQNAYAGQYGLSFTSGNRASFDTQMGAGVIDTNYSWNASPGSGATITYGFRQSAAPYSVPGSNIATFTPLTAAQIAAVEAILQVYSELCGVTFVRVNPSGLTNSATMLFANYNDANDGAGAFAYYPGSTASNARDGDVWLNLDAVSASDLPPGSYSHSTIMHEIGHALGLSHPGLYNAAPGVDITYADDAQFVQDSDQYSVMSYFNGIETGAGNYADYADTPMLFDVLAVQNIYGANTATRAGDTVYGFNSTAGTLYDFTSNAAPAFCIWDGGGVDKLDGSDFAQHQTIDLREGAFSSFGGIAKNISIALGVVIEDAVGGIGSDVIYGNDAANSLSGSSGDDTLNGGAGNDKLIGGQGSDTLTGGEGNDSLSDTNGMFCTIDGGEGDDVVSIGNSSSGSFNGGIGTDTLAVSGTNLTASTIIGFEFLSVGTSTAVGTAEQFDGFDTIRQGAGASTQPVSIALYTTGMAHAADFSDELSSSGGPRGLWLFGSEDDDFITSGGGNDEIRGANGNDRFVGGAGDDWLRGEFGDDTLDGGDGNDTADGGSGNDILKASSGADAFNGDLDVDTVDYGAALGGGVSVNLSIGGSQAVGADQGNDTFSGIENLVGSALGDTLTGDGENNLLAGSGGNDLLYGGAGSDNLAGGGGNDTYRVEDTVDIIVELVEQGYDTVNTTLASFTLAANVERANSTSGLDFVGTGNSLGNRFQSLGGDDRFVDVAGGADIFSGGAGTDTVDFRSSATGAVLNFVTNTHGGAAAGDTFSGIEKFLGSNIAADTMTMGGTGRALFVGGGGDDALTGGVKNDQLIGQGGNDTLVGNADRDALDGGTGDDTLTGGAAGDVFVFIDAVFGQDTITDYQDGLDSFKVFSAVADNVSDFTFAGNGTSTVVITLAAALANTITLNSTAAINITAADFAFY